MKQVVLGDPPRLPPGQFSAQFEDFVSQWYWNSQQFLLLAHYVTQLLLINSLKKDYLQRPSYKQLIEHPFIERYSREDVDVAPFFKEVLELPDDPKKSPKKVQQSWAGKERWSTRAINRSSCCPNCCPLPIHTHRLYFNILCYIADEKTIVAVASISVCYYSFFSRTVAFRSITDFNEMSPIWTLITHVESVDAF